MPVQYKRLLLVACVFIGLLNAGALWAQLPDGWEELSIEQFATAAEEWLAGAEIEEDQAAAIRSRATQLLQAEDLRGDERNWLRLALLADFTDGLSTQTAQRLSADDITQLNFATLHNRIRISRAANRPRAERVELVHRWLDGVERLRIEALSIEDLLSCMEYCRPYQPDRTGFTAIWQGQVTPPRDGEYTFSVDPLQVACEANGRVIQKWMTVEIDGQETVNATPQEWAYEGDPIQLVGGRPVTLKVVLRYETNRQSRLRDPASAILFWKGPGIQQAVIPPSALSPPVGVDGDGLVTYYSWVERVEHPQGASSGSADGSGESPPPVFERKSVADRSPNIDFAWLDAVCIGECNTSRLMDLRQIAFSKCTSPDYLHDCLAAMSEEGGTRALHHYLRRAEVSELFSTPQRKEFLRAITSQPELLRNLSSSGIERVYQAFRIGAADEALDLLGEWMHLNINIEPKLDSHIGGFSRLNRSIYRTLAMELTWQQPGQDENFVQGCLETEDGYCRLPAAYTIAYCHISKGQIRDWIADLDERLSETTLTGDKRVNWLIARAMAEEVRNSPPGRENPDLIQIDAGMGWLDEATLVAESPETKRRVEIERAARFTAARKWESAQAALQAAGGDTTSLQARVEMFQEWIVEELEYVEFDREDALIAALRKQRQSAINRGDTGSASRLEAALQNVEQEIP